MQIISPNHEVPFPKRWRRWRRACLIVGAVLGYSGLMVVLGATMHEQKFFAEEVMPYVRGGLDWPIKKLQTLATVPPHFDIDMKWEHHRKLAYQRAQALEVGTLLLDSEDYVPATITSNGKKVRVKMRLKGDGVDHLRGDKWSFRVRVRDGDTIGGMKQFSLHHPRVRNWMYEWLALEAMRREGVIALRYGFVDVSINGKSLGIYAIEEHFEKRLIESNRRREGPIIRFNEDLMWREIVSQLRPYRGAESSGTGDYLVSQTDGFQTSSMLEDPVSRQQYLRAVGLLEGFRRGELTTSQVFDLDRTATYFALIDLFGGEHGARWNNIRFYYNPVSAKLEPIAFDMVGGIPTEALSIAGFGTRSHRGGLITRYDRLNERLFADADFAARYIGELERVSERSYVDDLLAATKEPFDSALGIIYHEFPYYRFSQDVLYRNQGYIQAMLEPARAMHAYLEPLDDTHVALDVGNIQYLPVVVEALCVNELCEPLPDEVRLAPRNRDETVDYRRIEMAIPAGFLRPGNVTNTAGVVDVEPVVAVRYRIPGTGQPRRVPVTPHAFPSMETPTDDVVRREGNVGQFPWLAVDDAHAEILIAPGSHRLSEDLIVPAGFTLRAGPGTRLDLVEGAMVFSRSPLSLAGSEEAPVVIESSDRSGQGLVVMAGESSASSLSDVTFSQLTSPTRDGWTLTGAVTFYESPVEFRSCQFLSNQCEDGLNLVRSSFRLSDCVFNNTYSDAFDADFCEGLIERTHFTQSKNDAVDVSGSVIELRDVDVFDCGDKGISAGEASQVRASSIRVRQSRIGLASKDLSEVVVNDVRLANCDFGIAVFQKKPEFGPGRISIGSLEAEAVGELYLIEAGSEVEVAGRPIEVRHEGVKAIVYGDEG